VNHFFIEDALKDWKIPSWKNPRYSEFPSNLNDIVGQLSPNENITYEKSPPSSQSNESTKSIKSSKSNKSMEISEKSPTPSQSNQSIESNKSIEISKSKPSKIESMQVENSHLEEASSNAKKRKRDSDSTLGIAPKKHRGHLIPKILVTGVGNKKDILLKVHPIFDSF